MQLQFHPLKQTAIHKAKLSIAADNKTDYSTFFAQAPNINRQVSKITGVICGYRVEEIEDKLMQQIRYLDKLIDELAKSAGRICEAIPSSRTTFFALSLNFKI